MCYVVSKACVISKQLVVLFIVAPTTQRRIVVPGAATDLAYDANTTVEFALQSLLYVATCCRCLVN